MNKELRALYLLASNVGVITLQVTSKMKTIWKEVRWRHVQMGG